MKTRVRALIVVATVLVMANIIQFPFIEQNRDPRFKALNISETGDLLELGLASGNVAGWYSLHAAIGAAAPGARVVIPESAPFSRSRLVSSLYSYGRADSVEEADYDYLLGSDRGFLTDRGRSLVDGSWTAPLVQTGPGRTSFDRWILVVGSVSDPATELLAVQLQIRGDEYLAMIDSRLLKDPERWGL